MKYLGVHLDLRDTTGSEAHAKVLQDINSHLSHLLLQPGSSGPKIDYILFKLFPIAMTTAVCANWTLKKYQELDVPFSRAFKLILGFTSTFLDALLSVTEVVLPGSRLRKPFILAAGSPPTARHLMRASHFMICALSEKQGRPTPMDVRGTYSRASGKVLVNPRINLKALEKGASSSWYFFRVQFAHTAVVMAMGKSLKRM
jgi:hypothetical protein